MQHDTFGPDTLTVPAGTWCNEFAVTVTVSGKVTYHFYANGDGRFNVDYLEVYTANGHTVIDKEPNNVLIKADGTVVVTGASWHFRSVHQGNIELDAGRIVYAPDGTVIFEAGTHPIVDRQQAGGRVRAGAFCQALGGTAAP